MPAGDPEPKLASPIVAAIIEAETRTTGEIHAHLSRRWFERDPLARANRLFQRLDMSKTPDRNAVLVYVNLRKRRLAVVADEGIHKRVGEHFWQEVADELRQDLRSTHFENAISAAVLRIGGALERHFPARTR
jgi:uncharacterized membrane protein